MHFRGKPWELLMPGEGYEGYKICNGCHDLLWPECIILAKVGVGVATSVGNSNTAFSKKALMGPWGSHNENERAAEMETLADRIMQSDSDRRNGRQVFRNGVHIENTMGIIYNRCHT